MMNETNYKIFLLTDEEYLDPDDDNVDVEVVFDSGKRYAATLFTLSNIQRIMNSYQSSGECNRGIYFWTKDMVIVQKLNRSIIKNTISNLIATNEFEHAFYGPLGNEG